MMNVEEAKRAIEDANKLQQPPMMRKPDRIRPDSFTWVCIGCGEPKTEREKALRVQDHAAVDFHDILFYDITWWFCNDCKERMMKRFKDGIRPAVKEMKAREAALKKADEESNKNRDKPRDRL